MSTCQNEEEVLQRMQQFKYQHHQPPLSSKLDLKSHRALPGKQAIILGKHGSFLAESFYEWSL
jgi:hypothetical protein